jgi:hypothetical protein
MAQNGERMRKKENSRKEMRNSFVINVINHIFSSLLLRIKHKSKKKYEQNTFAV